MNLSRPSRAGARANSVRFAAIIGHADDATLLESCIAHHLGIGVERIFVSLNESDPKNAGIVRTFAADDRVRAERLQTFATDAFEFFTAALLAVRDWCAPEWLLFLDTDEFWIPARGQISQLQGLEHHDLLEVPRFNAALLAAAGAICANLPPSKVSFIFGNPPGTYASVGGSQTPWIQTRVGPKIMVRPELVSRIERGAHSASPLKGPLRVLTPTDLLILHAPFTSRARFEKKIAAIRHRLSLYGARFGSDQAGHWRKWMLLDTQKAIEEEFNRQVIAMADVDNLIARGTLTTPAELFKRWSAARVIESGSRDEEAPARS